MRSTLAPRDPHQLGQLLADSGYFSDASDTRRFTDKVTVTVTDGCWLFSALDTYGYGQFSVAADLGRRRTLKAHRVAYEALIGPIPEGLVIDHLCRNRACVNPDHMEPVTIRENLRRGAQAQQTHCKRGHEFTPENTALHHGRRECRACDAQRQRQRRAMA